MVEQKDVVVGLLTATTTLAALTLVFLGFVLSATSSFGPGTEASVLRPYRISAIAVLVAFALSILCVGACTWWLVDGHRDPTLYGLSVVTFAIQLAFLVAATLIVARQTVWRD